MLGHRAVLVPEALALIFKICDTYLSSREHKVHKMFPTSDEMPFPLSQIAASFSHLYFHPMSP